jgi:hypothetical protein
MVIILTKTEYLKSRIADLEKSVNDKSTPQKLKKIQRLALMNYKMDLERELASGSI